MNPTEQLVAIRAALDAAAQQATVADEGVWWPTHPAGEAWVFIAAWSPVRVLALIDSLRTVCEGIESTLDSHEMYDAGLDGETCTTCGEDPWVVWPCATYTAAVSSLAGLAAVWAPQ